MAWSLSPCWVTPFCVLVVLNLFLKSLFTPQTEHTIHWTQSDQCRIKWSFPAGPDSKDLSYTYMLYNSSAGPDLHTHHSSLHVSAALLEHDNSRVHCKWLSGDQLSNSPRNNEPGVTSGSWPLSSVVYRGGGDTEETP